MIIPEWKMEMIINFWFDMLRTNEVFSKKDYSIQDGSWCSVGTEKRFEWRWGNKHPEDFIKNHIIGWNYVSDKTGSVTDQRIEIYTGIERDETVVTSNPNEYYRNYAAEMAKNINIVMKFDSIEMDNLSKFEAFSREDMDKLFEMLKDPDKVVDGYYKKYPKFEYDMKMEIDRYIIRYKGDRLIKLHFTASNKILPKEGLFIGFEGRKDDGSPRYYVFKVIEKTRNINKNHETRDNASYIAEFHGYFTPTEEEIENASFQWIVNEEIIKTANHEARLT